MYNTEKKNIVILWKRLVQINVLYVRVKSYILLLYILIIIILYYNIYILLDKKKKKKSLNRSIKNLLVCLFTDIYVNIMK